MNHRDQDEAAENSLMNLAPPDVFDPVIEAYKEGVDRTLIRENLKLTYEQRLRKLQNAAATMLKWRGAAQRPTGTQGDP